MLCYAIFKLYPTRFSLLMEDFALVVCGMLAVLMLSGLAAWLIVIVLLIILLPTYLLGVLRPTIRKIALRLQNEYAHSKPTASNRPIRCSAAPSRAPLQYRARKPLGTEHASQNALDELSLFLMRNPG